MDKDSMFKREQNMIDRDLVNRLRIDKIETGTPIHVHAYRKLRELIVSGYYKKGEKILSEAELASIMGIGRTSLRTALVLLYEDGYIRTFHGRGTFVVYEPSEKLAKYPERYQLPWERLKEKYTNTGNVDFIQNIVEYDEFLFEKLEADGDSINTFVRAYTADDEPALYTNIFYLNSVYCPRDFKDFDSTQEALTDVFNYKVNYVTCTFMPAPVSLTRTLGVIKDKSEHYIMVSSVWYDYKDKPIAYCKDHYNCDKLKFRAKFQK